MSLDSIDLDVDHYTRDDLLEILRLPDNARPEQIRGAVARQVSRFRAEGQKQLVTFFNEVQIRLLESEPRLRPESGLDVVDTQPDQRVSQQQYVEGESDEEDDIGEGNKVDEDIAPWLADQYLDGTEEHGPKPPSRKNMTKIFPNQHAVSKQQKLGVQEIFNVGVAQGQNNPTLINTTSRTMVIDSKLRENLFPHVHENASTKSSSSQFTISLTDPLKNCTSLSLTSVTLPKAWYNIDYSIGTNIMWVNGTSITVPSGHYDASGLADAITAAAAFPSTPLENVDFNATTGRFSLNFRNLLPSPVDVSVVFWSRNEEYQAAPDWVCTSQVVPNSKVDFNMGYFMGYRDYDGNELGNTVHLGVSPGNTYSLKSNAVYDLEGTKNVYVFVEDHNQNRLNSQILTIAQQEQRIVAPAAYAPTDLSYVCLPGDPTPYYLPPTQNPYSGLTQAQIYSINAIASNQLVAKDRVIGPQQSNLLGVIPVQSFDVPWLKNIVAVGNQLQTNKRVYFGPVDINRLTIKLLDDVGNTLNLHGRDWTFTAEVTSLYQY